MSPVDLDHAVLLERLARDGRRLDGDVRVGERVEVDPVGARGAHAAADLVVAEDHRAVHRGQRAGRLAEPAVEGVGGRVVLDLRRAARRTCRARRCAPRAACVHRVGVHSLHPPGTYLLYTGTGGGYASIAPRARGSGEHAAAVEGKPIEQVRAMWAAYARGGVEAMHAASASTVVEWVPLGARRARVRPSSSGASGAAAQTEQRLGHRALASRSTARACSPTAACARSARAASPTCSRAGSTSSATGRWCAAAGYATREEALEAIGRYRAGTDSPDPHRPPGRRALEVARRVTGAHLQRVAPARERACGVQAPARGALRLQPHGLRALARAP